MSLTPFRRMQLRRYLNAVAIIAVVAVLGHAFAPAAFRPVDAVIWASLGIALWIIAARRNGIEPRTYDPGTGRWASVRLKWRIHMTSLEVVVGLIVLTFLRLMLLPENDAGPTPFIAGGLGVALFCAQNSDLPI